MNLPRLLDSSLNEVRRIRPVSLSITERSVPLTTASMGVLQDENIPARSWMELYTVNGSAGIFRVKSPETAYGNDYNSVDLEHAICEVGDWIIRAEIEQTSKTLSQALTQIFAYYGGSKWQLGTVSASGNVVFSAKYDNLLSKMNNLIAQVSGALMTFDFSTSPWTINVVSRGSTVTAEGRVSRNIQSATIKRDDSGLCTRVYANGLGSGGSIGYMDADTISTYGVVEGYLSANYTAAQAQIAASQYLNQHKVPKYTISIDMQDLSSITGETFDRVQIGKKYRLAIPSDNVSVEENIITIDWFDVINNPYSARVTLCDEQESLITFLTDSTKETESLYGQTYTYIKKTDEKWTVRFEVTDRDITSLVQKTGINDLGQEETLYSKITQTESSITSIVSKTGINSLGQEETLYSKITQTATAIQTEVSRATAAESTKLDKTTTYQTADQIVTAAESYTNGQLTNYSTTTQTSTMISTAVATKIDKTASYSTVDSILQKALTDAQAAATTAASGCIAKTTTYQTAEAIVTAAVAQSATAAGQTYIAKTTTYQTADAIVTAAESYTNGQLTNYSTTSQTSTMISTAVGTKLDKTASYTTIDSILAKALTDAQAAATTAASGCVAKTATYQTADAIVTAAVAQSATAAGQTYIAKTTTYQTADQIVSTATAYTDTREIALQSQITQQAGKIGLVVEEVQGQDVISVASIVAAINYGYGSSSVTINADRINLRGHVSIQDLSEYSGGVLSAGAIYVTGLSTAANVTPPSNGGIYALGLEVNGNLNCNGTWYYGSNSHVVPKNITIGGTTYRVMTLEQ